jgi:hypothetical protein
MSDPTLHWLRHSLVVAAATLSIGCTGERPLGVDRQSATASQVASEPASRRDDRSVELGGCADLKAPAGSTLVLHVYATGVQIYRWSGTSWSFVAPQAVLSADAGGRSKVGTHYAGPTWESVSGSKVVGAVFQRCTPNATAIPWLSLKVVSSEGPGIFHRVTFIQRVNTTGGNAPTAPRSVAGEEVRVPYTAEYFFYRT